MHVLCLIIHILFIVIEIGLKSVFLKWKSKQLIALTPQLALIFWFFKILRVKDLLGSFVILQHYQDQRSFFFFQALTLLILIITSLAKLVFYDVLCEICYSGSHSCRGQLDIFFLVHTYE